MMKTKTKLGGLALVVAGASIVGISHGLERREIIECVPQYIDVGCQMLIVMGGYIVGKTHAYETYMSRWNEYLYEGPSTRAREKRVKRWL